MALPLLNADGRCGICNGEVTTGGCPRCTSTIFSVQAHYVFQNLDMRRCRNCGYYAYQHCQPHMLCPGITTFEPAESP